MLLRPLTRVLALALALACASPALGQSSLEGYGGQAGSSEEGLSGSDAGGNGSGVAGASSGSPSSTGSERGDGLAFTGLEVTVLGGIALVLVGSGIALRRLSAPRHEPS